MIIVSFPLPDSAFARLLRSLHPVAPPRPSISRSGVQQPGQHACGRRRHLRVLQVQLGAGGDDPPPAARPEGPAGAAPPTPVDVSGLYAMSPKPGPTKSISALVVVRWWRTRLNST